MRAVALAAAVLALAAPAAADVSTVVGTWRGESLCTVKPSPCNDEAIVYHFARGKKPDTVVLTANKVVDGTELSMGDLDCTADAAGRAIECPIPNGKGTFHYQIAGPALRGTLTLADGTLYRRVAASKAD